MACTKLKPSKPGANIVLEDFGERHLDSPMEGTTGMNRVEIARQLMLMCADAVDGFLEARSRHEGCNMLGCARDARAAFAAVSNLMDQIRSETHPDGAA